MAALQEAVTSPVRLGDSEPGGWRRTGRGVLLPLGFAALATVGWEILCRMTRISPLLLPPPSAVWAVLSETATGLVSAKPEVLLLCRSLTASEWQMFRMARFPYAMPFVFAGMKVGVTMAMIGVIVGEFITAQAGLGYIIMFASSAGETATVLAAIVLLCGIGLALYGIVALGELAVQRWYGGEMPIGGVV